jgi:tetratricopeptide (TPR) repeat protein
MRISMFGLLLMVSIFSSAQKIKLSTSSTSLDFYYQGWEQVMDRGNYSASEDMYRQMMKADPSFLVGATLLGRISTNLSEQQRLLKMVESNLEKISGDERRLLDVYLELHRLMIMRQTEPEKATVQVKKALGLAYEYLPDLALRYPEDVYHVSEYIEVINYIDGPETALNKLDSLPQELPVFLVGYKAHLLALMDRFDEAMVIAEKLMMEHEVHPKPWVVTGDILVEMEAFDKAKPYIEKALQLDPKNVDAQRLKTRIEEVLTGN